MYKLLLVDDDKALLESFYKFIDWNKFGFEVVARFCDGTEALEYIAKNPVNVVITDIKMPIMDGIELAKKLSERFPDVKVVFVSAFSDFQYARQAIKYRVVDYISKPISHEEVEELLIKLSRNLEKEQGGNADNSSDYKLAKERECLFSRVLSSAILDTEFFKNELAEVQIPYQALHTECALAIFEIMGMEKTISEKWGGDRNKIVEAITNVVCVDTKVYYAVCLNFSDNMLAVLYVSREAASISKVCTDTAVESLFTMYKLITANETFLTFGSLAEFKNVLIAANSEEMRYLKSKIIVSNDEQMIADVEKYVEENYAKDISIKTIAERYHFNEKHIGKLFKKVMGKSFFDYLGEVRIENAKRLLASGEEVERVLSMVGFGSRRNFDRQFLYYTGETPGKYRKNQMEKK